MSRRGSKKKYESESEEEHSEEQSLSEQSEDPEIMSDEESEGDEWRYKLYKELTNLLYDVKPNISKNDIIDFHGLLLGWLQKNPQP